MADKEVIKSLLRELALKKEITIMAKITLFKDTDGQIKQAQQFEVVNRQEILDAVKECELSLISLNQALVDFDAYTSESVPAEPQTVESSEGVASAPVEGEVVPTEPTPVQLDTAAQSPVYDTTAEVAPQTPVDQSVPAPIIQ